MEDKDLELVYEIVRAIDNKKGEDIRVLNLSQVTSICDYFIIASADSSRQVKSIADEVEDQLQDLNVKLLGKEGYQSARWILMDFGDIVVHLFHEEDRAFYNIERIWRDGVLVDVDKIVKNNI